MAAVFMVTSLVSYIQPKYGDYIYPSMATAVGCVFSVVPIVQFIVPGMRVVHSSPGRTLYQKLRHSVRPTRDWQLADDKVEYLALSCETKGT